MPSQILILTYVTRSYRHWFDHFYLNLQLLHLHTLLHVCTNAPMQLPTPNVTVLRPLLASSSDSGTAASFGSRAWGRIVNEKHLCVHKFYRQSDLLFLDSDVTLFRSPLPYLRRQYTGKPLFMEDSGPFRPKPTLNTGCMFLPCTRDSWAFVDGFLQHLRLERRRNDQDVLNMHKPEHFGLLRDDLFVNGYRFYEARNACGGRIVRSNVMLVHHNWIAGDLRKWNRAKTFDCILNESSRTWFPHMLPRALMRQPWVYRKTKNASTAAGLL